jgi:hypothetical protein
VPCTLQPGYGSKAPACTRGGQLDRRVPGLTRLNWAPLCHDPPGHLDLEGVHSEVSLLRRGAGGVVLHGQDKPVVEGVIMARVLPQLAVGLLLLLARALLRLQLIEIEVTGCVPLPALGLPLAAERHVLEALPVLPVTQIFDGLLGWRPL